MRRRVSLLAAGALLLLLPSAPAIAAEPTLSGVVALGGAPSGGVPVAWFTPGSSTVTTTRTDIDGRFSMPAPPAGTRYLIAANVDDLLTQPHTANARFVPAFVGAGPDAEDVAAAPLVQPAVAGGGSRTVSMDVGRTTVVRGVDTAFAGSPVMLRTMNDEVADVVTAGSTGAWSFRVTPGDYRLTVDAHEGWLAYRSAAVHVGATTLEVRTRPTRTAALRGTVEGPDGRPLKGAFVSIAGPEGIAYPWRTEVRTDRRGRYVLGGLAPARYRVSIVGPGPSPFIVQHRTITVPAAAQVRLDAGLRRGATLTATVQVASIRTSWQAVLEDAHGAVVRTAASLVHVGSTRTPLSFTALPAGDYRLLIAHGDRMLDRRVHLASQATVRLGVLRPRADAITVHGTAPAGAYITFELGHRTHRTTAGADGAFRLGGLVPGTWAVRSQAPGHLWNDSTVRLPAPGPLTLGAGVPTETETHLVHGTVTAGGILVPAASVQLRGGSFLGVADGRMGDGRTTTNTLSPGEYDVTSVTSRYGATTLLPRATPYYFVWTGPRIVVMRGAADPDLGTIDLAVRGGP